MLAVPTPARRAAALALAAGALLTVTGCALLGPQEMSIEDAGERYLNIVCTSNAAGARADAIIEAAIAELDAGGNPDPAPFFAAAAEARDLSQRSAALLGSEDVVWPEVVADDIKLVQRLLIGDVTYWEAQSKAGTLDAAWEMDFPAEDPAIASSAQVVRSGLNLGADLEASCVGFENGHAALTD